MSYGLVYHSEMLKEVCKQCEYFLYHEYFDWCAIVWIWNIPKGQCVEELAISMLPFGGDETFTGWVHWVVPLRDWWDLSPFLFLSFAFWLRALFRCAVYSTLMCCHPLPNQRQSICLMMNWSFQAVRQDKLCVFVLIISGACYGDGKLAQYVNKLNISNKFWLLWPTVRF